MNYKIIKPTAALQQSYNAYIEELGDEERYPMPMDLPHENFGTLLRTLEDFEQGKNLPDGLVANTTLWFVEDNELIGVANIRHTLNENLMRAGGHIGIGVRPSYRGKGLSKLLLVKSIDEGRHLGISDVHIHCYADNIASVKMIESCGGQLNSKIEIEGQCISRYVVS